MDESIYRITPDGVDDMQLGESDIVRSVCQTIHNVLTTPLGTVPMYRDFGVNMDFLDLPGPAAEQQARMEIREAIEKWEPRAIVRDITFDRRDAANGRLIPVVEVEIIRE